MSCAGRIEVKTLLVTVEFAVIVPEDTKTNSVTVAIPLEDVHPQAVIAGKYRDVPKAVVRSYCTTNVEEADGGRS
jgi:hypothetical protein